MAQQTLPLLIAHCKEVDLHWRQVDKIARKVPKLLLTLNLVFDFCLHVNFIAKKCCVFENIFRSTPVIAPVPICTVHFFFLTSAVKGKHWCQGKGMLKPIDNSVSSSQPCFSRTVGCMVWWKLCCSHCLCWKMWWWILWFHSQLTCVLRSLIHTLVSWSL